MRPDGVPRGTKPKRDPFDFNPTPPGLCTAICARLSVVGAVGHVIEPSAGTGNFVRAAKAAWPGAVVTAVEIQTKFHRALNRAGADYVVGGDWRRWAAGQQRRGGRAGFEHLVLGNPPFNQAREHVDAALSILCPGEHLAFLLKLSFLGSHVRVPFWRRGELRGVAPIVPRPSFREEGTDAQEYGLFIWRRGYRGRPELFEALVWRLERSSSTRNTQEKRNV